MNLKIKIRRCDPLGKGVCSPFLQAYDLEVGEGMTVLEALLRIVEEIDPTLAFRRSCRSAICGSCAMMINGIPRLACNTQILPIYEKYGKLEIEPLGNATVLKDLIVETEPFWRKIDKVTPYLTPVESYEKDIGSVPVTSADMLSIENSQKCIMCGCCNGACNALEVEKNFVGPAALAKAWRFVGDVREGRRVRRLEQLNEDNGMWDCTRCIQCTEYCPKGVNPLEQIESLRAAAIKEGVDDGHGAKHSEAMAYSIERVGRLDEAAMTFKTLGFIRSIGMVPMGIKMGLKGKMPTPILFKKIDGMDEVEKLFELNREDRAAGRGLPEVDGGGSVDSDNIDSDNRDKG